MRYEDDYINDGHEIEELINKYNLMIENKCDVFFDLHELEVLGDYYFNIGNLKDAGNVIKYGLKNYPYSLELKIKHAQLLIDKGLYNQALAEIKELIDLNPSNSEINLLMGIISNVMGMKKEAAYYFKKAIMLPDAINLADYLFSIALSYQNVNDYHTAYYYLKEAYRVEPKDLSILWELANCSEACDYYDEAVKYYNLYLDEEPFSSYIWFNLGVVYTKLEKFEKALEAFEYVIALTENDSLAYYNKANALANLGKYEEAIKSFNEYISLVGDCSQTYCNIGECYERIGDFENALNYYQKALSIDDKCSDAIFGIGIIHSICNKLPESVKFIKLAIEIDSNVSDYYYSLGTIYYKMNQHDKAIKSFEKAIELDPKDYESWLQLADIYYSNNLLSKAIKILEEAYHVNSDIALISYRLAAFYLLKNNINEGIIYFRKAITKNFREHKEIYKYFPDVNKIKEINDLIKLYKSSSYEF